MIMQAAAAIYSLGVTAAWLLADAWNHAEIAASIAAAVIALAALGFSLYEGRATRKHNRLSVKPFLVDVIRISPAHTRMCLIVKNNGLGPAIIRQWSLLVDGKPYKELGITQWQQLTQHLGLSGAVNYSYFEPYHALATGDFEELVGMEVKSYSQDSADLFRAALRRLTVIMVYESMYQETFRFEFQGDQHFCQKKGPEPSPSNASESKKEVGAGVPAGVAATDTRDQNWAHFDRV